MELTISLFENVICIKWRNGTQQTVLEVSVSLGYYNTQDDFVHTLKESNEELELLRAFKCI